jgi:hypothetical protein
MTRRKRIVYGIALMVFVGMMASVGYLHATRGVYVRVTNDTQSTLKHIDITYTGGVVHTTVLEPKASYGRRVNPAGESALKLEWLDSAGAKHSHWIDVYLEHDYRGTVEITVESDGRVSVIDRIKSPSVISSVLYEKKPLIGLEGDRDKWLFSRQN